MRYPLKCNRYIVLCFLLAVAGAQLFAQAGGAIKVIKVDGDQVAVCFERRHSGESDALRFRPGWTKFERRSS